MEQLLGQDENSEPGSEPVPDLKNVADDDEVVRVLLVDGCGEMGGDEYDGGDDGDSLPRPG